MSTALALRLEFAMRSLEVAASTVGDAEYDPNVSALLDKFPSMRRLVDQAIEELSS